MLAGERAAEFENEVRDGVRDRLEHANALFGLEIHDRTHVETSDRRMRVDASGGAVAPNDVEEPRDEILQPFRRNGRVLDEGKRLVIVLHRH
jgi:hypothetical protein